MEKSLQQVDRRLATRWKVKAACPAVPLQGIANFHVVAEESGVRMAAMKLDADVSRNRVYTGHGDQPNNKGKSRFGTASQMEVGMNVKGR
ncbi:MAG: hypothetical protein KBH07_10305 [Flavobacteriales bacterium]|nr:hypothetical protein [Flavobacteriales bacterium]MBP9080512.1 hypothetical protein [Flavobacteriales bacterium]